MNTLNRHWPEYLMEAAGLGIFMISAGLVTVILDHPASPIQQVIPDALFRRFVIGVAMGLTAIAIIYSPWGKQSGAHINPAVTLTFFRLGKIHPWDAFFYIVAQFVGGLLGLLLVVSFARDAITHPKINYIVTIPGSGGAAIAFLAEFIISFVLMLMVLFATNHKRWMRFTGVFVGLLLVVYITFEAPFSGMSLNPARTVASALLAQVWTAIWVYFISPLAAMLAAA
jgi:aquaporin Z